MEAGEDYARRSARIKSLLASYYGEDKAKAGAPAAQASASNPGPSALDAPTFNAERHAAQVLKTYKLDRLVSEHGAIAADITQLHRQLQDVVYRNYAKFMDATDAVRTMKGTIEGMSGELGKLKGTIDGVVERSQAVECKLQGKRERIEELQQLQGVLARLQAAMQLPRAMAAALRGQDTERAVALYTEALPLLRKYGQRPAIKAVAAEAASITSQVAQGLKQQLGDADAAEEAQGCCLLLLRRLGEPDEVLLDKCLQGRRRRLLAELEQATAVVQLLAGAACGQPRPLSLDEQAGGLNLGAWGFVEGAGGGGGATGGSSPPSAAAFVALLGSRVLGPMMETVAQVHATFSGPSGSSQRAEGTPAAATAAAGTGGDAAAISRPLGAWVRDMLGRYLRLVRQVLADSAMAAVQAEAGLGGGRVQQRAAAALRAAAAAGGQDAVQMQRAARHWPRASSDGGTPDWGVRPYADALVQAMGDLQHFGCSMPDSVPMGLGAQADDLMASALQHHVGLCFAALQARLAAALQALQASMLAAGGTSAGASGSRPKASGDAMPPTTLPSPSPLSAPSPPHQDSSAAAAAAGAASTPQLAAAYQHCCDLLDGGLSSVLSGLQAYEEYPQLLASRRDMLVDLVQSQLQALFLALLSHFCQATDTRLEDAAQHRQAAKPFAVVATHAQGFAASLAELVPAELQHLLPAAPAASTAPASGPPRPATARQAAANNTTGEAPGLSQNGGGAATEAKQAGGSGRQHGTAAVAAADHKVLPGLGSEPGLVLLLSRLALHVEQSTLSEVMGTIAHTYAAQRGGGQPGGGRADGAADARGDLPPAFVAGEVARRAHAVHVALLRSYVEAQGRQLSRLVRASAAGTDWLRHKEPRGPRPVCGLLLERLGRAAEEVAQLVPDAGGRGMWLPDGGGGTAALGPSGRAANSSGADLRLGARGGSYASLSVGTADSHVARNVAKLFRDKVKIFGSVPFTQSGALAAITGVGLKSLVECIRLQTLGRAGLQQLQLDAAWLRPRLQAAVGGGDQGSIGQLLEEAVSAGLERSLDPQLLESAVLDRILAAAAAAGAGSDQQL